jgi:hypothetical protein
LIRARLRSGRKRHRCRYFTTNGVGARRSRLFDPNMYRAIGPGFFLIAFENLRWTRLRGVRTMEGSSETVSSHRQGPRPDTRNPSARTYQASDTPRASARNRRLKASDRIGLPAAGTGRCPFPDPPLFTLASFQPVALQPLSRRRPLSSTGTGAVYNELHGVGRYLAAAGPCDAVTDIRAMSKTVKWRLPTSSSGASSSSRPS